MFAIGIGTYVNPEELREISSDPDDKYMYVVDNFNDLHSNVAGITGRTCNGNYKLCETVFYWLFHGGNPNIC